MARIKKGDIVGRNSYGKDILFIVEEVIKLKKENDIAILKGLTERIIADAPIGDLVVIDKIGIEKHIRKLEHRLKSRLINVTTKKNSSFNVFKRFPIKDIRAKEDERTGRILHLDGDKKYTEKSYRYYKKLGLDAIVRNIAENRQPFLVRNLLEKYQPDILVVTGHDGMIKNETGYQDLYNYRNSKYFIKTVEEARKWDVNKKLVIFAGACQSFFEALISAGANFASSPARILIDFADPLIVAEKVAITEKYRYITIEDIAPELRDGTNGIGGIGASGKKEIKDM